jgi:hypothetical protein
LAAFFTLGRDAVWGMSFGLWTANWMLGIVFSSRVAPFEGSSLRVVRRSLEVTLPPEAGYRDEGETEPRLRIDTQPIERRRLGRVALGRFREPRWKNTEWDPWSVNLVLSDGIVRVAKLREATAHRLAEALAAALDVPYDPAEVADIVNLPGHPFHWAFGLVSVTQAMVSVFLAFVAGFHETAAGWIVATAIVLAFDVGTNDLLGVPYLRRKAEAEARSAFREAGSCELKKSFGA